MAGQLDQHVEISPEGVFEMFPILCAWCEKKGHHNIIDLTTTSVRANGKEDR